LGGNGVGHAHMAIMHRQSSCSCCSCCSCCSYCSYCCCCCCYPHHTPNKPTGSRREATAYEENPTVEEITNRQRHDPQFEGLSRWHQQK
jgi:hypothetical protein